MTTAIALAGSPGPMGTPGDKGGVEVKGRPTMNKAQLVVYAPSPAPGGYKPGAQKDTIAFQFNPKEVTIAKSAKWERKPAKGSKSAPPPEFTGSDPCKLTVEMFFDATGSSDGSVMEMVEKLFGCCVPTEQSAGQKKPTPPLVVLHWDKISTFPGGGHLGQRQVHPVPVRRHADPGGLQRVHGGDARIPAAAESHLRQRQHPPGPPHDRRRQPGVDRLRRVRGPGALAPAGRVQRHRRPASTADRADDPPSLAGRDGGHRMSMCLVEIDGSPMPEDLVPLLISAYVEDSQRLPDMFALRFRDPERIVLSKSNAKVGGKLKVKVNIATSSSPTTLIEAEITALELEFDSGGTFTVIRGYDPAHRLFRDRRTVSYVQMTASDIATQVAKRAGLKVGKVDSTSTVFPFVSQAGQTDWEILTQLARDAGLDLTVRNGSFSFAAPADAGGSPAVLKFGEELVRFRSILTSAQQVGKVEVRGWNVAEKTALVGTAPAKTSTVELPTVKPTDMASAFGNPTYVSTDVPYRTQNEVDQAAKALAEEKASAFAEFEGVARGNPDLRAGRKVSLEGLGAPFEGKYTITSRQAPLRPDHRLHHRRSP